MCDSDSAFDFALARIFVMLGATIFQAVATFCGSTVGNELRKSVQGKLHELYFQPKVAYAVSNIHHIDTVDQRLTEDLSDAAHLFAGAVFNGLLYACMSVLVYTVFGFIKSWFMTLCVISFYVVSFGLVPLLMAPVIPATMEVRATPTPQHSVCDTL